MSDERDYLRLLAVMAIIAVVVSLSAGVRWSSTAFPTPVAPPVARVTSVGWTVTGCDVSAVTLGGTVVAEQSGFPVTASLTNSNPTRSCTLTSVAVSPTGFTVRNDSLPAVIGPGSSATIGVGLVTPTGWYTGPVVLLLGGVSS